MEVIRFVWRFEGLETLIIGFLFGLGFAVAQSIVEIVVEALSRRINQTWTKG